MEISKKLFGVIIGFVIIFGLGAAFAFAGSTSDGTTFFGKHSKMGFMSDLTEEQISTLMQTKMDLKEEGATREEMHAAMKELYEEWGLDYPDFGDKTAFKSGSHNWGDKSGSGEFRHLGFSGGEGCSWSK